MNNLSEELPKITIWIAARNEEFGIIKCLTSLENLNYPKHLIQILVGNDQSTDNTASIVANFIKNKPRFELVEITQVINNQRGKANVLANLYERSTGKYFLITDADVQVNRNWAYGMVSNFIKNSKMGHQVGITTINSNSFFGILQAIDWLWALTLLKMAAFLKIPLTGLGNNSAISRQAYEATGGYAQIPFSITEDFALFHEVVKSGFEFDNAIRPNVFAKTTPMNNLAEFLYQRKRWMVGAMQCPWWVIVFLYVQAFFPFILLIISILTNTETSLSILFIKIMIQIIIMSPTLIILNEYRLFPYLILYEFYAWIWGFIMVIFYFLPIDIDWKGRIYAKD